MTALRIELAWPDKSLSPNARVHRFAHSKAKAKAKDEGFWSTRAAMGATYGTSFTKMEHDGKSDVILNQTAYPPSARHYDRDNLDASLKAHRDGIANALGVNDRFFRPTGIVWGDSTPNGKIIIEVQA